MKNSFFKLNYLFKVILLNEFYFYVLIGINIINTRVENVSYNMILFMRDYGIFKV